MKRSFVIASLLGCIVFVAGSRRASELATQPAPTTQRSLLDRVSCSSLCQAKQPLDVALKTIAGMGFKYVDLSCVSWAPHVSVGALLESFPTEAQRVETALKANGLQVSNLTFDAPDSKDELRYFDEYEVVLRLAVRLNAPLINVMAPSKSKTVRYDENEAKLRRLRGITRQMRIQFTIETHVGQLTELPKDAQDLCDNIRGMGLTLDPSHYYAGPNQGKSFEFLYPHVLGTGLRAGGMSWKEIQLPWGEGPIDFAQIITDLEVAGYQGYYVVEYIEGFNKVDAVAESKKFLEWARKLSAQMATSQPAASTAPAAASTQPTP